jgi:hypothetical protein
MRDGDRTPESLTVAYVATANNNVVASAAPTGQVVGKIGGGAQSVSVDFFTDDGNPATNLSVTSDLTALAGGLEFGDAESFLRHREYRQRLFADTEFRTGIVGVRHVDFEI